ncbi:uncharacterized protein LOC109915349 [Rhincodon typus]|uniref:uncharacterized protein LOC109915349 n=1 Tax=Rhincodon typus TaxID=259920 RepID=UPI00202E6069|nr:uncharacterized protein LOC109915349 [Rhincodon typus]
MRVEAAALGGSSAGTGAALSGECARAVSTERCRGGGRAGSCRCPMAGRKRAISTAGSFTSTIIPGRQAGSTRGTDEGLLLESPSQSMPYNLKWGQQLASSRMNSQPRHSQLPGTALCQRPDSLFSWSLLAGLMLARPNVLMMGCLRLKEGGAKKLSCVLFLMYFASFCQLISLTCHSIIFNSKSPFFSGPGCLKHLTSLDLSFSSSVCMGVVPARLI